MQELVEGHRHVGIVGPGRCTKPAHRATNTDAASPPCRCCRRRDILVDDGLVDNLADANQELVELGKVDDEGVGG